jgi:Ni/Co efflux regulator RcnB
MRKLVLSILALSLGLATSALAQSDPLSGTWKGDWGPSPGDRNQVTVELKWDGKALTGTVNPGPNAVALSKATFDSKTNAVHFEADAKGRSGNTIHYVNDGKVDGKTLS